MGYPQIIHCNQIYHQKKTSILGYPDKMITSKSSLVSTTSRVVGASVRKALVSQAKSAKHVPTLVQAASSNSKNRTMFPGWYRDYPLVI